MDSREYPRVQLPIEVDLLHPTIGKIRRIARDVSEGGVFVVTEPGTLRAGAKLKLTVVNTALIESTPTPTVDMEVVRVTPEGLGLKFVNSTSEHLWSSVQRLRRELQIGRDYFQVFQAGLIINRQNKLLVVQQHGKWLFPGDYLEVGNDWKTCLTNYLKQELGLDDLEPREVLGIDSAPGTQAGEGATFSVFHRFSSSNDRIRLRDGSRYRQGKWVGRTMSLEELTFSHPVLRALAISAFDRVEAERKRPPAESAADAG
jgi:ADP-ribose pyrophosphatase YjhB (NUDIX family)